MAIIYRAVKGSPLTIGELDGNFEDLDGRVQDLEDVGSDAGRRIDFIEQVGNSLVVHYDDLTTDGPFSLGGLNLRFRGEWEGDTNYLQYDVITAGGATYMVLLAHLSDSSEFDPGANNGSQDYYGLLLENPSIALPTGGDTDAVLVKLSATNFDTGFRPRGVPPDGEIGDILFKTGSEDGDHAWGDPGSLIAKPLVVVADAALPINSLGYANTYIRLTNDAGCDVTIPLNADIEFPTGTEIDFRQCGVGGISLIGDSDSDNEVLFNAIDGFNAATDVQGAVITIKKIGENVWDVWGLLQATSA